MKHVLKFSISFLNFSPSVREFTYFFIHVSVQISFSFVRCYYLLLSYRQIPFYSSVLLDHLFLEDEALRFCMHIKPSFFEKIVSYDHDENMNFITAAHSSFRHTLVHILAQKFSTYILKHFIELHCTTLSCNTPSSQPPVLYRIQ